MKNISLKKILLFIAISIVVSSCKKDSDDPQPSTGNDYQRIAFHLHSLIGADAAAYGQTFQTADGRKFNISDFRYYISNIVFIKSDGSEYPMSGKVVLASPSQHDYDLGTLPVGSYSGFRFVLGLDSATNHMDPTTYSADNPLAIQSPGIHWSWNSGYIFMKVEGMVDTTLAANGPLDLEYFYHVGMDVLSRDIDFSNVPFTVSKGTDYELGLEFDLLKVLANVDMRLENETHTFNNMPLAAKIADNWQGAFSLE